MSAIVSWRKSDRRKHGARNNSGSNIRSGRSVSARTRLRWPRSSATLNQLRREIQTRLDELLGEGRQAWLKPANLQATIIFIIERGFGAPTEAFWTGLRSASEGALWGPRMESRRWARR